MTNIIQTGSNVSLHYQLSVDGAILEDSRIKSRPLKYIHGKGKLLRGFIDRLQGLRAGDERDFELPPEEAHGLRSESRVQEILKTDLHLGVEPKLGMRFNWKNSGGKFVPCTVAAVTKNSVKLDNNHPMAGKTLVIHVQILTVE